MYHHFIIYSWAGLALFDSVTGGWKGHQWHTPPQIATQKSSRDIRLVTRPSEQESRMPRQLSNLKSTHLVSTQIVQTWRRVTEKSLTDQSPRNKAFFLMAIAMDQIFGPWFRCNIQPETMWSSYHEWDSEKVARFRRSSPAEFGMTIPYKLESYVPWPWQGASRAPSSRHHWAAFSKPSATSVCFGQRAWLLPSLGQIGSMAATKLSGWWSIVSFTEMLHVSSLRLYEGFSNVFHGFSEDPGTPSNHRNRNHIGFNKRSRGLGVPPF